MYQPISDRGRSPGLWAAPVRSSGILGGYYSKVLSYGPIAYWPLWETSGTTAECLVNPLQNGTYARDVSVMGTGDGIGDSRTAPKFDGTNDLLDIATATLLAALNTSEGSTFIWTKTDGAGPWTDGATRYVWNIRQNVSNRAYLFKSNANNTIASAHSGAGVTRSTIDAGHSEIVWTPWCMTWSVSGGTVKMYVDGALADESAAGVTAWAGAAIMATIGAYPGPITVWDGWLAHCAIFDGVLTLPEIQDLSVV